ncbi:MAG: metallophosphoesterase family protein [Verrucomicrobiia bacterium]
MKYAILGDIHANLEALQAVLADAEEEKCTHFACLGDVVGYGPNPCECLEIIRKLNCPVVMGNHDEYSTNSSELIGFNPMASEAIKWTRQQLSEDQLDWLRNLKYTRMIEPFTLVHATLDLPEKWAYVFDKLSAAASITYQRTTLCFYGHTHLPIAFVRSDKGIQGGMYSKIKVEFGRKYFINAGSIGQPRDRNPKAAYMTFDLSHNMIELRRVDYDIPAVQAKIRAAKLPESLADRLMYGR